MPNLDKINLIDVLKEHAVLYYHQISSSVASFFLHILSMFSNLWGLLKSLPINPSGLSDVAAFSAVIIGLWIPLSIEIITRISDRYKSEVIVTLFERRWQNRWLPRVFIFNLLLTVLLRFFIPEKEISTLEIILSWLSIIIFITSCAFLVNSIKIVKIYTYKTDYILQELINDAKKILK